MRQEYRLIPTGVQQLSRVLHRDVPCGLYTFLLEWGPDNRKARYTCLPDRILHFTRYLNPGRHLVSEINGDAHLLCLKKLSGECGGNIWRVGFATEYIYVGGIGL